MLTWEDSTSYSQKGTGWGRGECESSTWETMAGQVRIVVTRWHHGDPNRWYLLCKRLGVDIWKELAETLEDSKALAVDLVRARLKTEIHELSAALAALDGLT